MKPAGEQSFSFDNICRTVRSGLGITDWHVTIINIRLRRPLWMHCPRHAGHKGNDRADRLVGKATITGDLRLRRSNVLRSLRPYLRGQSQGQHTTGHLEERGAERGNARRSSLKERERAIVNHTNTGTVSDRTGKGHNQPDQHWNNV